jgi:acyl dehydratase
MPEIESSEQSIYNKAYLTKRPQMRIFKDMAEMKACVGQEIAVSDWLTVTQERVNQFAEATGDHQWIHVDPERAKAGPFGAPIAHGFLTLSLIPYFFEKSLSTPSVKMGVNYGLNRVRFMAPVKVGAKLRAKIKLLTWEDLPNNGSQVVSEVTLEIEGSDKPACVAESIARRYE